MSIIKCNCKNEYQDSKYGKDNRVHNECAKGERCTVCLKVKGKSTPKK